MTGEHKRKEAQCADTSRYEFWFSALSALSGKKKIRIKQIFPDAEEIYRTNPEELQKRCGLTEKEKEALALGQTITGHELDEIKGCCIQKGIRLICFGGREYPDRLKHIGNPPYSLYFRGAFHSGSGRPELLCLREESGRANRL